MTDGTEDDAHIFAPVRGGVFLWCCVCGTAVLNVFRQGYQCTRCHKAAHTACLEAAERLPCCSAVPLAQTQEMPEGQEGTIVVAAEAETDAPQPQQETSEDAQEPQSAPENGPCEDAKDAETQEPQGEKQEAPQDHEESKEHEEAKEAETEPQEAAIEPQEAATESQEVAEDEREAPAEPPKPPVCVRSPSPAEEDREQTRVRHHALAVKELIDTEQQYYGDLLTIVSVFKVPLEENPQLSQLITKADFNNIFSNFDVFPRFHSELLSELLTEGSTVGSSFLRYVDFFGVYVSYCNNMDVQDATVKRLRQENPAFEEWVQTCKKRPECRQQDISGFLVKPFQRLCRYPLLFEAILRLSEPGPETDRIRQVVTKIQAIAKRINRQKRQMESNAEVVDLQERLWNPTGAVPLLISPARVFLRHGEVDEIDPAYSRPQTTEYILCSDLFVRAYKRVGDIRLEVISAVHLNDVSVEPLESDYDFPKFGLGWYWSGLCREWAFRVRLVEYGISVVTCFLNKEDCDAWFDEFAAAKKALADACHSSHLVPLNDDDDFEIIRPD